MLPLRNCYRLMKSRVCVVLMSAVLIISFYYVFERGRPAGWPVVPRILGENFSSVPPSRGPPVSLRLEETLSSVTAHAEPLVTDMVHVFYYPWYGNPEEDSSYIHWNHEYIANWDTKDERHYPTGKHVPPEDIGSNFYPKLGCYSSKSVTTIEQHMKWIRSAGIGVLVVSWYPPSEADQEGKPFDRLFPLLLDTALNHSLKIAFHVEPYKGRNPSNFKEQLRYITSKYGHHRATYRMARSTGTKPVPVFYIYDSYLSPPSSWNAILNPSGKDSVRGTQLDGVFIGLVVELRHKQEMLKAGFDGFYTYFAANEFTYGSSFKNWKSLSTFARRNRLLFSASVGPGYVDTQVRPWNGRTFRDRNNGQYYRNAWHNAIESRPDFISITSFNEWHEGTQIEPAVPKQAAGFTYADYLPDGPDFYLQLTRQLISRWLHADSPTV